MGLFDMFGGSRGGSGGMSPLTMGLLGLLAYRTFNGKGRLADMLGRTPDDRANPGGTRTTGGGWLDGVLGGGAAGGILSGGLGDLIKSFQQHGQGDKAESWVSNGPNKPISPPDLAQALGPEKIDWLMRETGMSRDELLAGLSRDLPRAVDELTPEGRLPDAQEAARLMKP